MPAIDVTPILPKPCIYCSKILKTSTSIKRGFGRACGKNQQLKLPLDE